MARALLALLVVLALRLVAAEPPAPPKSLVFSAGFSSDAVLQRGPRGVSVYGFASGDAAPRVAVTVAGEDATGNAVSYEVAAQVSRWQDDGGYFPATGPAPPHGPWLWKAVLRAAAAGGDYSITASDGTENGTAAIERVTFGDVWFCSGQSNMALSTFFTFSVDALKEEIRRGKYANVRHFMFGDMGTHFEATTPQWATTQNSVSNGFTWYNVTSSAAMPTYLDPSNNTMNPFLKFGSTCMYFGIEMVDHMASQGLGSTPIGLIQSAIGGSQIESWMSNETLRKCSGESLTVGSDGPPLTSGALYYGMLAPFANYSVRGWVWYQGENNCYGDMGRSSRRDGYGCELPAMVDNWRAVWDAEPNALFGVATLAGGGSEGFGYHMAGMRWSQTANYGVWPNPAMPHSFGAQAYDLEDPWSNVADGNKEMDHEPGVQECCWGPWSHPLCLKPGGPRMCTDKLNCSLPDISTGRYGDECSPWDSSLWSPSLKPVEAAVRANAPSGIKGNNFMGTIHVRLKRPLGRRLAWAAVRQMSTSWDSGAATGPTIAGCSYGSGRLELQFNSSLLGSEELLLGHFNSNVSSWSPDPSWADRPSTPGDSLGTMVCTANASEPERGNATTCACLGWNYLKFGPPDTAETFWYCEDGPGYKPPKPLRDAERARREKAAERAREEAELLGKEPPRLGWVPATNPFMWQWKPAALRAASSSSVVVDTSTLGGLEPLAVRMAWPLFDAPAQVGDTCCQGSDVRSGRAPCVPGSCALYTSRSELPANPFFARIIKGACECPPPQSCGPTAAGEVVLV